MASSNSPANETRLSEEEAFLRAVNTGSALLFAMSFRSALELGLLDIIAKAGGRGLSAAEIAAQLSTENPDAPDLLDRILGLLAANSVLKCTVVAASDGGDSRRIYELAPVGTYYVPNEDRGASLAPGLPLLYYKPYLESWGKLTEAILKGGVPFDLAHGISTFEYIGSDPTFNTLFNIAMTNESTFVMKKIIEVYKGFDDTNQLVDVGGGVGDALKIITSQYPHIKGINYDLPHVIQQAIPSLGVEHIGGDMFESVPSGQVIWLKWVLHNWDDSHCIKLLKNCYKALPDKGKMIVVEAIIPEAPETTAYAQYAFQQNVSMITLGAAGKERTLKEFWSLAKAVGFTNIKVACRAYHSSIMEFYK